MTGHFKTAVMERSPGDYLPVLLPALLAGLFMLYFWGPAGSGLYPVCPFHAATGLHCPGCGTLRGLHLLLHGDLLPALSMNPLMVLSLPFVLYAGVSRLLRGVGLAGLPRVHVPAGWIWAILFAVIAFTVLRNLAIYPCTLLAP